MFKAERLTPTIGAVISGVSLNHLDSKALDRIYDSLIKHQVIFFRNQDLTPESHMKLACLLYTSPSPRDVEESRMPSSA